MSTIRILVDEDYLLDLLLDRVDYWGRESDRDLYEKMYSSYLDSGVFENVEFSVSVIVDNDIINYCKVITQEDYPQDFEKLLQLYHTGSYDVSCESFEEINPSFIEAVSDDETRILVRY